MIPTTTGAAKAVALVIPELKGKFDGMSMRVPTPTVSIVDFVATVEKATTKEELGKLFEDAANGSLKGILGVTRGTYQILSFQWTSRLTPLFDCRPAQLHGHGGNPSRL